MNTSRIQNGGIDHPFEQELSVLEEDIEFELRGHAPAPWVDFWLNPRRLRGADFLMRWSQGEWSEKRLVEAVNATEMFCCYPYGPSGVAPENVREYELYFERLEAAGLGQIKRPDLLIFHDVIRKRSTQSLPSWVESRNCRSSRKIIRVCVRYSRVPSLPLSVRTVYGERDRCLIMEFR